MEFSDDQFALYAGIGQSSASDCLEINITRPQAATTSRHAMQKPRSGAFSLLPCDSRLTHPSHQLLGRNKKLCEQQRCSQKYVTH